MPQIEQLTESPPFPVNSPGPEEIDPVAGPEIVTLDSRLDEVEGSSVSGLPSKVSRAAPEVDADIAGPWTPEFHGAAADGVTDDTLAIQAAIDWVDEHRGLGGEVVLLGGTYLVNTTTGTVVLPYDDGTVAAGSGEAMAAETQTTMPYCLYLPPGIQLVSRNGSQSTFLEGDWVLGTSPIDTAQRICIKLGTSFGTTHTEGAVEGITLSKYMVPVLGVGCLVRFSWKGARISRCGFGPVIQTMERGGYEDLRISQTPAGIVHGGWWTTRANTYLSSLLPSDFHHGWTDKVRVDRLDYSNSLVHGASEDALDAFFDTYFFKSGNSQTGSGFTSAPVIGFAGGGGSGATATASIDAQTGRVTGIAVTAGGSGYATAPTVTFTGGGGAGAAATAIVSGGVVTGVAIGRASAPQGGASGGQINTVPYRGVCGVPVTFHSRGRGNHANLFGGPWFVYGAARMAVHLGRPIDCGIGVCYLERVGFFDPGNYGADKIMGVGRVDPYRAGKPAAAIYGVLGTHNSVDGPYVRPVAAERAIDLGGPTSIRGLNTDTTYLTVVEPIGFAYGGLRPGNYADSDALVLDWYQEGTFTPNAFGTSTAGAKSGTASGVPTAGRYTRIGNRVFFSMSISWTAHTGSGNLSLSGLPFVSSASMVPPVFVVRVVSGLVFTGPLLVSIMGAGTSSFSLRQTAADGTESNVALPSTAALYISGSYEV